jgi:Uri superfamily endonuclease
MKGTYLLILERESPLVNVSVGKLGCFDCVPGYYLYVGSAFGPGGLSARLKHHQKRQKLRPHWHLDYLRPYTKLLDIWTVASALNLEQRWCTTLSHMFAPAIPGFGASDSHCLSHLLYSAHYPSTQCLSLSLFACIPFDDVQAQNLRIEIQLYNESS